MIWETWLKLHLLVCQFLTWRWVWISLFYDQLVQERGHNRNTTLRYYFSLQWCSSMMTSVWSSPTSDRSIRCWIRSINYFKPIKVFLCYKNFLFVGFGRIPLCQVKKFSFWSIMISSTCKALSALSLQCISTHHETSLTAWSLSLCNASVLQKMAIWNG